MSSADFATALEQSVQAAIDAIDTEAEAAKARVFARVALARPAPVRDDPFDAALASTSAPIVGFDDMDSIVPGHEEQR